VKITVDLLSGVTLLAVHVRELRFVDNREQSGQAEFPPSEVNIEINTAVSTDGKDGTVRLGVTFAPQADVPPFRELYALIEGQFRQESSAVIPMNEFVNRQGPVILMPFARDAIATATIKTRFGAVLLPPINVAAMIERVAKEQEITSPQAAQAVARSTS
jgi:preprotein translocase subunit SecB